MSALNPSGFSPLNHVPAPESLVYQGSALAWAQDAIVDTMHSDVLLALASGGGDAF